MTTMKYGPIATDTTEYAYSNSNAFSFPNNPNLVTSKSNTKKEIIDIPYRSISAALDFNVTSQIMIRLAGTMYGTNRYINMRNFIKQFYDSGLHKLWLSANKFIYVYGSDVTTNLSGRKSLFNDYLATCVSPVPFWYTCDTGGALHYNTIAGDNTESDTSFAKTNGTATSSTDTTLVDSGSGWSVNAYANYAVTITGGTGAGQVRQISSNTSDTLTVANAWTTNPDTDSTFIVGFANYGSAPNHIYRWEITNNDAGAITSVIIAQGSSTGATGANEITWTGSLTQNEVLEIWLFYTVSNELILHHCCEDSARTTTKGSRVVQGVDAPQIPAGTTSTGQDFTIKVTGDGSVDWDCKAYFWNQSDWVM